VPRNSAGTSFLSEVFGVSIGMFHIFWILKQWSYGWTSLFSSLGLALGGFTRVVVHCERLFALSGDSNLHMDAVHYSGDCKLWAADRILTFTTNIYISFWKVNVYISFATASIETPGIAKGERSMDITLTLPFYIGTFANLRGNREGQWGRITDANHRPISKA
jgi:hypothetical protein